MGSSLGQCDRSPLYRASGVKWRGSGQHLGRAWVLGERGFPGQQHEGAWNHGSRQSEAPECAQHPANPRLSSLLEIGHRGT